MPRTLTPLAVAIAGFMLFGCQHVRAPIAGRQDPYAEQQIHFTSDELRSQTAVGTPLLTRDPQSQLLYVQVPVRNTMDYPLRIDYRVSFFDRNGNQLWQTGWFDKNLAPNVPDRITTNSTDSRAADFRIDIRPAQ